MKATAYAYLKAGIPILLNAALYDTSKNDKDTGGPELTGCHAVAVTGFCTGLRKLRPYPGTGTLLRSSKINELYVHDDQVGPFARLTFGTPPITFTNKLQKRVGHLNDISLTMGSSFPDKYGKLVRGRKIGPIRFAPFALILPLYHKIRIGFDTILCEALSCDLAIELIRAAYPGLISKRLEWEVFLTTVGKTKSDIQACLTLPSAQRWAVLEAELPRFIWRVIARDCGVRVLEFLYDATDIEQGNFLDRVVPHDQLLHNVLQYSLRDFGFASYVQRLFALVPDLKHVPRWLRRFRTGAAAG